MIFILYIKKLKLKKKN